MPFGAHDPRPRLWLCALVMALAGSGFAWPGSSERLVKELTSASTPRDKRDGLRLLRIRFERGEWTPEASLPWLDQLVSDREVEVRMDALRLSASVSSSAVWLPALEDLAPAVRAAAVEALGLHAETETVPLPTLLEALLRASGDPDARVRLSSLSALAHQRDPRATAQLVSALRDPALEVRVQAAHALGEHGQTGGEQALSALLGQLDEAFPELRVAALEALAGLRDVAEPRVNSALIRGLDDLDSAVVLAALRGLARAHERALPARVAELVNSSPSAEVVSAATHLLRRRRSAPVAAPVLDEAASTVGPPRDPAWLAPLEQTALPGLSTGESERLLRQLERVLPRGAALATDPLVEWLMHAPAAQRTRIAALIERCGGPISGVRLEPLLSDPDPSRRAAFVRLFAQADARHEGTLLRLLEQDPAPQVQQAAVSTLSRSVTASTWHVLAERLQRAARSTERHVLLLRVFALGFARPLHSASLIAASGRDDLQRSLLRDLTGQDDVAAALALRVLGGLGTAEARAAVLRGLDDPRPGRSIAALRASISDPSEDARRARRDRIESVDARIVATAVVSIALAGDPLPWPWLAEQLGHATWPVGPAAAFALAHGSAEQRAGFAELELCPLLASKEPVSRRNIAWAVAQRQRAPCREQATRLLARGEERDRLTSELDASTESITSTSEPDRGFSRVAANLPALPSSNNACPIVLQDARVIVSFPDASGQIDWPRVAAVRQVNAWPDLYER